MNQTARFSDVASGWELDHSEFSDFLAKVPYRHALAAVIGFNGQPLAAFSVHRRKGKTDFSRDEIAIFDRVAPHLGRALALRSGLGEPAAIAGVGILAFGAGGELLFMNSSAQRFCVAGSAGAVLAALPPAGSGSLRLGPQRYRVDRLPWRASSLLTALAAAESLPFGAGGCDAGNWRAVKRRGDGLTIVALTPFRCRDDIRGRLDQHGLSRREIEIAARSIVSGVANSRLAECFCISAETLKSHLREAYRKIGVGSRQELIVKILGLDGDSAFKQRDTSD